MMIVTIWCLYLVLNILYYAQKVSCDITIHDILQNFVYSVESLQLNGVSIKFDGVNFISYDKLRQQAYQSAIDYVNKDKKLDAHNFLVKFQEYLPDIIYCKYSERITDFIYYLHLLMEACETYINNSLIDSLNKFIQKLVVLVVSIQEGVQYVSRLSSRQKNFQRIPQTFIDNPLKSGPIEVVGIQNYLDYVLSILSKNADNYMKRHCRYANENNIPNLEILDFLFGKRPNANETKYEFIARYTDEYFTETNIFMAHLNEIYQNLFGNNNQ
ncbi:uncharacterized protein LOC126906600 [Daktulosphaira vitifoliae]|uniref:uncharacterized protein LOC126906600 n=1 Tax=Daktulosphaira vitifoliae TaxID=58002 RepID=UPI0021A9E172|nr:uncharacterized protein LOC126906600 [Daktulosphaira vitifoliae]